jgi:biopolymer transport protein ExbD
MSATGILRFGGDPVAWCKNYFKKGFHKLWNPFFFASYIKHFPMAEMNTTPNNKRALKVDLTPMVDLGFILISFFLFTTTLSSPTVMKLVMPDQSSTDGQSRARSTLTLYPGAGSVRYEEGKPGEHPMQEAFLDKQPSLRDELIRFRKGLQQDGGAPLVDDMTVIIKPSAGVTYGQLIGVLDEMTINNVKKYMVIDSVSH